MKDGRAPIHWGGHWRRGKTRCCNGHPYTVATTGTKSVKRWSKTLQRWVVYKTRLCRRCRRVSERRKWRKGALPKRGRWYAIKNRET